MPIFEYQCQKCQNVFEELVMSSKTKVCCPSCQSRKVKRLMSAPSSTNAGKGGALGTTGASACGTGGFS
jgi:putative FmdB family regulatory protein